MLAVVKSMALDGLTGYLVSIQVDISDGLPCFEIVGLPDISIRESKQRVKTAIKNTKMNVNSKKIIINLAPANTKKEGSKFDFPIAIGILIANGNIKNRNIKQLLSESIFIGELSLNGKLEKVNGVLAITIEAKKLGIKRIFLPSENSKEASVINGIDILPVNNLYEIIEYLNGNIEISTFPIQEIKLLNNYNYEFDFEEVKGQELAKRALEISAAGGHNCILIGSPGSGKTMLAKRFCSILPDMNLEEALEVTKIYSLEGLIPKNNPLMTTRPYRTPHYTVTKTALIGGGKIPKPGEISLAHYGILFLDELPEFNKNTLEVLRAPLEDNIVTISRVNATLTYPCDFMFVASMNPCPCGFYGASDKECNCSEQAINKYMGRISGPLLDRIDIQIEVTPVKYEKLQVENNEIETSEVIKARVNSARKIQLERYKDDKIYSNSQLTPKLVEKYCKLDSESKKILQYAFDKLHLSARAHVRILKVSRTIADLSEKENIQKEHIAEAIQYRNLDKKYWKN